MIVPDQHNLKVHYAGMEDLRFLCAVKTIGVKYGLFTAFPFIRDAVGLSAVKGDMGVTRHQMPQFINGHLRHCIMDSGLFTLMFGALKGQKDQGTIARWQEALIAFIQQSNYQGTAVEVDCQKVLSPDAAWAFRYAMREALPQTRIINVFHIEDGQVGLDQMIEFSDYIALSIPELRIIGKKEHALRVASYIKNRKPEIDIHLLGCTEQKMLAQLSFCSSADSTSWISVHRFGEIETVRGKFHVSRYKGSVLEADYAARLINTASAMGLTISNPLRFGQVVYAGEMLRMMYTESAGDQS